MKRPKFTKVGPGEWQAPKTNSYLMACCDCGLVHKMEFRNVYLRPRQRLRAQTDDKGRELPIGNRKGDGEPVIIFRAWRDEKATAVLRAATKRKARKASKP